MAEKNRKTTTKTTKKVVHPDSKRGQTSHRPPSHQTGPKKGSKSTGGSSKKK